MTTNLNETDYKFKRDLCCRTGGKSGISLAE